MPTRTTDRILTSTIDRHRFAPHMMPRRRNAARSRPLTRTSKQRSDTCSQPPTRAPRPSRDAHVSTTNPHQPAGKQPPGLSVENISSTQHPAPLPTAEDLAQTGMFAGGVDELVADLLRYVPLGRRPSMRPVVLDNPTARDVLISARGWQRPRSPTPTTPRASGTRSSHATRCRL